MSCIPQISLTTAFSATSAMPMPSSVLVAPPFSSPLATVVSPARSLAPAPSSSPRSLQDALCKCGDRMIRYLCSPDIVA